MNLEIVLAFYEKTFAFNVKVLHLARYILKTRPLCLSPYLKKAITQWLDIFNRLYPFSYFLFISD